MSSRTGQIAEHEFELICLKRDIPVFKPVLDCYGIDFITQSKTELKRIQVKSTLKLDPSRNAYKVTVVRGFDGRKYSEGVYDLLVVYIFEIATWYIIPEEEITAKCIRLNPDGGKGRLEQYKERWDLLLK